MDNHPSRVTTHCRKCGIELHYDAPPGHPGPIMEVDWPALCAKCELVNALLVERYTTHERTGETDNGG